MRNFFLTLIAASLLFLNSFAQDTSTDNNGCYALWAKAFELRGSHEIKDGWYEGVVISIRHGSKSDCYSGKVSVENGTITSLFFKFVDGQYEPFIPKYKYNQKVVITNGISKTMQTTSDELINVFFIDQLLPKKKAYERAPLPSIDDF